MCGGQAAAWPGLYLTSYQEEGIVRRIRAGWYRVAAQIEREGAGCKTRRLELLALILQADVVEHDRVVMTAIVNHRIVGQADIVFAEAAVIDDAESGLV